MNAVELKAHAKINLTLDVLYRRPDGYHEIRSVMQALELHDLVSVREASAGLEVACDDPWVPEAEGNLVARAAAVLREATGCGRGAIIRIEKRIPLAAGLAGGSSDAAAALLGLNQVWNLGLDREALLRIAARVGSDVPFCLLGGTALAEGRGEIVTPLPPAPEIHVVLAKPEVPKSTEAVYSALRASEIRNHPNSEAMAEALRGADLFAVGELLGNILEGVMIPRFPLIAAIKVEMLRLGAPGALMTGSGPTIYGLARSQDHAREIAAGVSARFTGVDPEARRAGVDPEVHFPGSGPAPALQVLVTRTLRAPSPA